MDDEPSIEAKELVGSDVVLEDGGDECCVVEDAETPMVLDNENKDDNVNVEFTQEPAGGILEPMLGMEFASEDDARNFYNMYAKQMGFSIRVNSYYRSKKDNSIISREFCCSKEGFRRDKRVKNTDSSDETRRRRARPITREGCKALMTVRTRDNGKWYVAKLEKHHNHEMVTPAMRHFLRSHKEYNPDNSLCASPGTGVDDSMNAVTEDRNSVGKMVYDSQNHATYVGRGRLGTFGIDAQGLLGFFKIMQAGDPAFYYAIQVDEEDRLSSVFWVDTRSRIAYNCFSDVVAFDTTYRMNKYKMPFAPCTGVNHHKQSVLFGCALLADESESTFIWLFTTWLAAMSGRQPRLIVTDYDSAITRAVERVFPQSTHRYCKWHIISKMPKEMGLVYGVLPKTFQAELDKCINKSEATEEFESAWQLLLDKYNLQGNEWLQSLYIDRKLWVPIYVRDTFFAGTNAAQRSGSVSSLFDGYVNARTTLQDFANQYDKALDGRYEKEAKAEFETFYTKPVLKTPLPMERQAAEVYTRKLFSIVQDEIFESLLFAAKLSRDDGRTSTYEVARFDEEQKVYIVALSTSEQTASCSCKMFEFEGILCRHVIAVFKATNVFLLPQHYILKRWTRNAKDEATLDVLSCVELQGNSPRGKNSRYSILYQEAIKCVEEGMASDHTFMVALNAFREARIKIFTAKKNAIKAQELETMASISFQDENTISSQIDSSPVLSSSGVRLCTSCNCPARGSHSCMWVKDSDQNTLLDNENQELSYADIPCSTGVKIPPS